MNDPIVLLWSWLAVGQPDAPLVPAWLTVTVALATAGMLLEALLLLAWHRRTGRGLPPGSLLPTLAAGGGLMGALLVVLTGAPTPWMLALLALAGVAHVLDLRRRWQPRAHQRG